MVSDQQMLFTADDVARILNVSRSFAYKMMQDGTLPVVRLGRAVRVRPVDLNQFLETRVSHSVQVFGGAR